MKGSATKLTLQAPQPAQAVDKTRPLPSFELWYDKPPTEAKFYGAALTICLEVLLQVLYRSALTCRAPACLS